MKRWLILLFTLNWICLVIGADPISSGLGNEPGTGVRTHAGEKVGKQPDVIPSAVVPENIQTSEDAQAADRESVSARSVESLRAENVHLREMLRRMSEERKSETERLKVEILHLKAELAQSGHVEPGSAAEAEVLRRELIETLEKSSENLDRLKILELSAASVLDTLEPVYMSSREVELMETLELVFRFGADLAGKSASASEKVLGILPETGLDEVERAKLRVALEEVRKSAGLFARLVHSPADPTGFESCRILAVDDALGVVVLSAGYRSGVRVNLRLWAENDSKTVLKVVALRSFVCAAIPEEGTLRDLVPGMKVSPVRR